MDIARRSTVGELQIHHFIERLEARTDARRDRLALGLLVTKLSGGQANARHAPRRAGDHEEGKAASHRQP
jgi:hypothetical protein